MENTNQILIVIQRSNGDVFFSSSLIKSLYERYNSPKIDLLINDDTYSIANLIPYINKIYTFSYQEKKNNRWRQEKKIFTQIYKKYDLSISLTASDRSVLYASIAGKKKISAVELNNKKSWWKKILLTNYYYFDSFKHILVNNLESLKILKIDYESVNYPIKVSKKVISNVQISLKKKGIGDFIIFHPSAQYSYKVYPKFLRNKLLRSLDKLGVPIVITGGAGNIDLNIKKELPDLRNLYDFVGKTTLEEYFALSQLSLSYIGMDTLNMHIAASQNKPIFAIFGPTNIKMWSPWANNLKTGASINKPIQNYDNITIFQASLPCVACGNAGCDNNKGRSECLYVINPLTIFNEVSQWYENL